jgi:hypothetical protein
VRRGYGIDSRGKGEGWKESRENGEENGFEQEETLFIA